MVVVLADLDRHPLFHHRLVFARAVCTVRNPGVQATQLYGTWVREREAVFVAAVQRVQLTGQR